LVQLLHQARFAPGGLVFVDDALLGSFVQGADSRVNCLACLFQVPFGD
jgi:hypothetical protein